MEEVIKLTELRLKRLIRNEVEKQMNDYIIGERIKTWLQDGKMVTEERKFFLFREIIEGVDYPIGEIERMTVHGPFKINLDKGLIQSYPDAFVVKMIGKLFHLKSGNQIDAFNCNEYIGHIWMEKSQAYDEDSVTQVECSVNPLLIEKLKKVFKTYGWFLASDYGSDLKDGNYKLRLEKKFFQFVKTRQLLNLGGNYLCHISNSNLESKILEKGLIPQENNLGDNQNPPRLYCYLREPYDVSIDAIGTKMGNSYAKVKKQNKFNGNNNPDDFKGILFRIDLRKLNPEQKFYFDPRQNDALYTEEPIPYNAIKEIKPKELDPYEKFYQ